MVTNIQEAEPTKKKVYFIRVDEKEYARIVDLALAEDRSTTKMANLLLRSALDQRAAS